MDPVRVGAVRYLNTRPLIEGVDRLEGLRLVTDAPAGIVGLLERGEVDIGLASVIDAARSATPMTLLPVGVIASDGPTHTVRLFSSVPPSEIGVLYADEESHTSVALAQLILRERFGVDPRVVSLAERQASEAEQAILMIGDKVVLSPPPSGEYPHVVDLGQAWREWTGLPMVYGAWMCPAYRMSETPIVTAVALLDRQLRHNLTRLRDIAARRAPEHGWSVRVAEDYLTRTLHFTVSEREREGAELFIARAHEHGLCGGTLAWADTTPAPA